MTASAAAPTKIKGTSITTPTETGDNHTLVLGQLKEVAEIAQRLRGDPKDSFVRVSELMNATGARLVNNTVQPASSTAAATSTVSVADSISGDGSSGSPLQLVGDSASPGNNMVYGTNGSGVKSWYAAGGGSYTPPVTTKGDLFGFTTVPARIAVGSNGKVLTADSSASSGMSWQTPGGSGGGLPSALNIPNLQYWFDASQLNANAGSFISTLQNFNPPLSAMSAYWTVPGIGTISGSQLNSKNVLALSGAGGVNAGYFFAANPSSTIGPALTTSTTFAVFNLPNVSPTSAIISGPPHAVAISVDSGAVIIVDQFSAVLVASSAALSNATWYQTNATYVTATGAYAFRIAQTPRGSGTTSTMPTVAPTNGIGCTPGAGQNFAGSIAEIIVYDRVLTGGEILTIEAYLFAKWGV